MVIAIIGLLVSTVLAALQDARMAARNAQRISEAKQLQNALEMYRNANGAYPLGGGASAIVYVNDRTPSAVPSGRQSAFRVQMATFVPPINDRQLSGSDPDVATYGNLGSIRYTPNPGLQTYTMLVYLEGSTAVACTLNQNDFDCE